MAARVLGLVIGAASTAVALPLLGWKVMAASQREDSRESYLKRMAQVYHWLATRPACPPWDDDWDSMKLTDDPSPVQPRVYRNIFLIRHGQYVMSGTKNLTELGRKQAAGTGVRLRAIDKIVKFDYMVNSNMPRAVETADIIHTYVPHLPRSCDAMLAEGRPCYSDPPIRCDPAIVHEDSMRIEAAFRHHFHRPAEDQLRDSHELIVCHANVIRYFVCRALQMPKEAWLRFSLNHCSITWVAIDNLGHVTVRRIGDADHLPMEMITRS